MRRLVSTESIDSIFMGVELDMEILSDLLDAAKCNRISHSTVPFCIVDPSTIL